MRLKQSLLALTCVLLTACGWHLQGLTRLPDAVAVVYFAAFDPYSDFTRALRRNLRDAGAQLVEQPDSAQVVIRVHQESFGRNVVSVSATNVPKEYEMFYALEYSVELPGHPTVKPYTLRVAHNYSYEENAILGKQHEEAALRATLARNLANQVLRRVTVPVQ